MEEDTRPGIEGGVIETLAEVYQNDKTAKEKKMTPLMRLHHHHAHSGPPMTQLHQWLTDQMESRKVEPNSGLGKAISYMLKHWEPLTLFLRLDFRKLSLFNGRTY